MQGLRTGGEEQAGWARPWLRSPVPVAWRGAVHMHTYTATRLYTCVHVLTHSQGYRHTRAHSHTSACAHACTRKLPAASLPLSCLPRGLILVPRDRCKRCPALSSQGLLQEAS